MERVELPPKFVIPGGTELSARLDVARTAVAAPSAGWPRCGTRGELADATVLTYLNRLSDALFAMARFADEPEPELFEGRHESDRPPRERHAQARVPRRGHTVTADEPRSPAATTPGRAPGAAGRQPGLLHGDHDGDVRQPQGLGRGRRWWWTWTTSPPSAAPTRFTMEVRLPKELPEEQRERLMQIAAKCPVHRTLEGEVMFEETVSEASAAALPHLERAHRAVAEPLVDRAAERVEISVVVSLAALGGVGEGVGEQLARQPAAARLGTTATHSRSALAPLSAITRPPTGSPLSWAM